MDHAAVETQRREIENECTAVRNDISACNSVLQQLAQQAATLGEELAREGGESSVAHVLQQRQDSVEQRAAVLAEEVLSKRASNQNLHEAVLTTADAVKVSRVWRKTEGTLGSTATTVVRTEQRITELGQEAAQLSRARQAAREQEHTLRQQLQEAEKLALDKKNAQQVSSARLSQAQSTSAGLAERLQEDPSTYMESLTSEHERRGSSIRALEASIASVRSETTSMERRISKLAAA